MLKLWVDSSQLVLEFLDDLLLAELRWILPVILIKLVLDLIAIIQQSVDLLDLVGLGVLLELLVALFLLDPLDSLLFGILVHFLEAFSDLFVSIHEGFTKPLSILSELLLTQSLLESALLEMSFSLPLVHLDDLLL